MGLVIGAYYRGDPRVKPAPWGNASQVQSSIFANAEREGIDPGSIALAMPMWGPGDQLDYANGSLFSSFEGTPYFANNRWYFEGGESITSTINNMPAIGSGQYTFVFNLALSSGGRGFFSFGTYDPAFAFSTSPTFYIYDSANKGQSNVSVPLNTDVQIGFCRKNTGAGGTDYYYNGVKDRSVTHADSLLKSTMTIGSDRAISGLSFKGSIALITLFSTALTPSQIAYLSDNPYFLLHRQPSVFYSVPSGAITLRQFGFRFYQDNADHTPIGTENDASVSLAPGSKFRIRMGICLGFQRTYDLDSDDLHLATVDNGAMFFHDTDDFSVYAGASGNTPFRIVFTDSGGLTAEAWCGEVGGGETLGAELVTNGGFEDYTGTQDDGNNDTFASWSYTAPASGSVEATSDAHEGANALKMTRDSHFAQVSQTVTATEKALFVFNIYTKGTEARGEFSSISPNIIALSSTASYASNARYFTSILTNGSVNIFMPPNAGNVAYYDDFSLKQLTDIPATGLKLYSTQNGTTKGMGDTDVGFNPNAITKVDIYGKN